uniref:Cytosol aminopeptidase n=1 Tax=Strigamia maritima TaxID=126957 RepID=T1IIZ4_STRMM
IYIFFLQKGLILGAYEKHKDGGDGVILSASAKNYAISTKSKISDLLNIAGPNLKKGKSISFFGIDNDYSSVAVVGLGPEDAAYNDHEEIDEHKENVRTAIAAGIRKLRDVGVNTIDVDPCGDACAAAEGASLALFSYDDLKNPKNKKKTVNFSLYQNDNRTVEWANGLLMGEGQNLARKLMEMPSNILTPSQFAQIALETVPQSVEIKTRGKQWIVDQKMGAFLSVAKGSQEPPIFLEMSYNGTNSHDPPVVLVGKGITFDSGGISLKTPKGMDKMRGDMGGGACTLAALSTVASMSLPINVVGLIPLCENMPSGTATKPGDVVTAMNGKTIQVDNTDAEGRLILADALCYAHKFQPLLILDMATLTGAMMTALGSAAAGVFTNSSVMWHHLHQAGVRTGDRVWRMPLFDHFSRQMKNAHLADLNNMGKGNGMGGACTAAAFLREFVTARHWVHIDIAGVMENTTEVPYLGKGLTGRPTRTIVEFLSKLSKNPFPK